MTLSRIALFSLLGIFSQVLPAQSLFPLQENYPLQHQWWQNEAQLPPVFRNFGFPALEKSDCPVFSPELVYLTAGQAAKVTINIDTTGLGEAAGTYNCINCGIVSGVSFEINNATLQITPDPDIELQTERILIEFCNSAGCRTAPLDLLIRRPGKTIEETPLTLPSEGMTSLDIPLDFPGAISCSFFLDCTDDYEGKEQNATITAAQQLAYRAARYPGTDRVCLVFCDENAICDTFSYVFEIVRESKLLPFFDDFSYEGPYPDAELWLDLDPYINDNMAVNPPSVGVATFDGLDSRGQAYAPAEHGPADRLTSTQIDLTRGVTNDVWLLFWLQRKGLGDKPEPADSMVLEFKNREGKWEHIRSFAGIPINQPNTVEEPFNFYREILDSKYLHDAFQFRFTNLSEGTGLLDNWHLDYVRLDVIQTDSVFNDVAFTQKPAPILKTYTSLPWRHFQGQSDIDLRQDISVGVFNHAIENLNVSPSSASLTEKESGLSVWSPATPTLFNALESNIPRGEPVLRTYSLNGDPSGFPSVWTGYQQTMRSDVFDDYDKLAFELTYELSNLSQRSGPG